MPKPSKTQELQTEIEQLKTDYGSRIKNLEETIKTTIIKSRKLERPTQWYEYFGYFILVLMVIGMLYLIWLFYMTEQGHNVILPWWMR